MTRQDILAHLPPDHPWADRIHYFDTIDSTNTQAKKLAAAGAPQGTVLIAGHQTGGRGRMGRSFHSPTSQGVYLSVILRPQRPPTELMHLTCAAGTVMCDAVSRCAGFRPWIKWINDLVHEGRKLGGILAELGLDPKTGLVSYAVVGIGINCSQSAGDFPPEIRDMAGSLSMAAGKAVSPAETAAAMISELFFLSQGLLTEKEYYMDRYRMDCVTIGKTVRVMTDPPRQGFAEDVDDDGGLLVRFEDGHTETVSAGEVSVRGMYGYV